MGLLELAILALIVALIAGGLGFSGIAGGAVMIAKILFGIFLFLAVMLFLLILFGIGAAIGSAGLVFY